MGSKYSCRSLSPLFIEKLCRAFSHGRRFSTFGRIDGWLIDVFSSEPFAWRQSRLGIGWELCLVHLPPLVFCLVVEQDGKYQPRKSRQKHCERNDKRSGSVSCNACAEEDRGYHRANEHKHCS